MNSNQEFPKDNDAALWEEFDAAEAAAAAVEQEGQDSPDGIKPESSTDGVAPELTQAELVRQFQGRVHVGRANLRTEDPNRDASEAFTMFDAAVTRYGQENVLASPYSVDPDTLTIVAEPHVRGFWVDAAAKQQIDG
jgi:hypothetical protein